MAPARYWWRATWRDTWRSTLVVVVLCAILGAVALGSLAGARRTESAYGRYLRSIDASDVMVNIPEPNLSVIAKVSALAGVRSSAAWLGLAGNPVVHGREDDSFLTDDLVGSLGDFFRQDRMTVLQGRLPRPGATDEIALTPGIAKLFGVGVGGKVTYEFNNVASLRVEDTGVSTYRVVGIVAIPPVLVDQFDQVSAAVMSPAATEATLARHRNAFGFSWVGVRLLKGSAGIPALNASLTRLASKLGGGLHFAIRQLNTVHQQVQQAIRPQAVALGAFGALAVLALLVLAGQGLVQLLDRSASQLDVLRAIGLTRAQRAMANAVAGAFAIAAGMVLAVVGALALSPLAPVGPVRQFDPVHGVQFDVTVLLGGGLTLAGALLGLLAWIAWRSVRAARQSIYSRPPAVDQATVWLGMPTVAALGVRYALEPPPGRRRGIVWANLVGSIVAVTAIVSAVIFGASLNGLVSHPVRYGWNWDALVQVQGGYGNFSGFDLNKLMASQPGVRGWSTFAFTQVPIDGQLIPVLGLATPRGSVEPPTVTGHPLDGLNEIELGTNSLRQLGKHVGDTVVVGSGPTARRLTVVGTVTLPSLGLLLTDHVSLGRGAMLPESTLLAIEHLSASQGPNPESFSALPSTLAVDVDPGTPAAPVVGRIVQAINLKEQPGGTYQVQRVLGAAVLNDAQMGDQPLTLAVVLTAAVLVSLAATVLASARRRRRELAVLKALGLTRRQLRVIIVWQTSTTLLIAAALGLPIGLAAGGWAWSSFASSIGAVPVTVIPLTTLILGLLVLVTVGNAMTTAPGVLAAHTPTADALRGE